VSQEVKDRWRFRMTSPSWYDFDWSHGVICWDGEFGPNTKMFVQHHPFAEGIDKVVPPDALKPYKCGVYSFAIALDSLESAEALIRRITERELCR
jgi:hypothetical protein